MKIKSKKPELKYQSFPDPFATRTEKISDDYGLQWAKAIEYQWFKRTNGKAPFYSRNAEFHKLRTYARGDQSSELYKTLMGADEEQSYTNYDWRPIQVIPKFVKLLVNQMGERLFEVKANATDPYSSSMRTEYRENLENLMAGKDMLLKAKELQGVDMLPQDLSEIPDTQEEIDLRMSLNYKQNSEIAAEIAVKFTFDLNDFNETQQRMIEDLATLGIAFGRHYTDPGKGVMTEYVDPANLVYSHPRHRDFKNAYYFGEVERITISELKRLMELSGRGLENDEEYADLASSAKGWADYHGLEGSWDDDLEGTMVDVLHFTFKVTDTYVYKKKYNKNGGFKMTKKDESFNKPDDSYGGYDVVKKPYQAWYEGTLVLGTEIIVDYKRTQNMVREKGKIDKVIPKYIGYAPELYQGKPKGLVSRIIQYVDLMQQTHIKIQQMIAKARPSGVYIDVDGLDEIPLGDGSTLTPLEVIKIYDETGNVLGTSTAADGSYNYGRESIRELGNGVVKGLPDLMNTYNFYLNQLRDAIGIPAGMDASNPHPDTLVGVQQQVALNSNTATRHILDGALHITQQMATGVNLRLKDIFAHSDLKEFYINAIGKMNVDILESLKNYQLFEHGIIVELKPDAEEKQNLENNIQNALAKELIMVDDAIDIRQVGNLKLANQLLKIRRQKREKLKREHELNAIKVSADENAKAAERAAAAKEREISAEFNAKSELERIKGENATRKIQAEEESKSRLMQQEFYYNMALKGAEDEYNRVIEETKQEREDKRLDKKLASQSQGKAPANTGFESSEDNISGNIEMGEMEPS